MIWVNHKLVTVKHFPDGTLLLKENIKELVKGEEAVVLRWNYENNEELIALYFLTCHIKSQGYDKIILDMPYIPNARQDRVKNDEDVFTLKYFTNLINSLGFFKVRVLDAHSNVSLALLERVELLEPAPYIEKVLENIRQEKGNTPLMFYPDEGAGKRYSGMISLPYCFGIKNRDWKTGEIKSLTVAGEIQKIQGNDVLIVDDICSYGGTFLHSAQKLHELGAEDIYLYISHCEKSILAGELPDCPWIKRIYTTNSIFREETNEKITVLNLEN